MKLMRSTTFKFSAIILGIGLLAVIYSDMTWTMWFEQAKYYVGIYASKEGVRYGAEAYKRKNDG